MAEWNATLKLIKEYGGVILLAIGIALAIRIFLFEVYRVPSASMRPTLEAGDTILVSKYSFGIRWPGAERAWFGQRPPQRGEVVIVSFPTDSGRDFVRRVIAIPGDEVEIKKGKLFLNQKPVLDSAEVGNSPFCGTEKIVEGVSFGVCWEPPMLEEMSRITVAANSVFVMGDLRTASELSGVQPKSYGMTSVNLIKGKVLRIWLSVEPQNAAQSAEGWLGSRIRWDRFLKKVD